MKIRDYKYFKEFVKNLLEGSISSDYSRPIMESIIGDVIEDVETSADENWNEDDVRLAIGRVLMDKLGIPI